MLLELRPNYITQSYNLEVSTLFLEGGGGGGGGGFAKLCVVPGMYVRWKTAIFNIPNDPAQKKIWILFRLIIKIG